jgi:hypothetical protein
MFEDVKDILMSKQIKYIEMHGAFDGEQTFGVATCYDWYVLQNSPPNGRTMVLDENGNKHEVKLCGIPFIPSGMFEEIASLIATDEQEKCEVLNNSAYHHQRHEKGEWMSKEKTTVFKYPCIYTITNNGKTINLWYSSTNERGHFGIPKVIFSNGAGCSPIVDATGHYGMTEFACGIVDTPENLSLIQKAMMTEKFLKVMKACQMQGFNRYSWKVMRCFKKDFWKQFVDENGNAI